MFTSIRPRFNFWLDLLKPDEEELAYKIVELKKNREFTKTIRDGIRLIVDLSQGKTEVLFELFPWVVDRVQTGGGEVEEKLDRLTSVVENLTQLPSLDTSQPAQFQSLQQRPKRELVYDLVEDQVNDGIEIKKIENSEDNIVEYNLRISMALNTVGHCNNLPLEMIEYGLRTKRISSDKVEVRLAREKNSGEIKEMDIPDLPEVEEIVLEDDLMVLNFVRESEE